MILVLLERCDITMAMNKVVQRNITANITNNANMQNILE